MKNSKLVTRRLVLGTVTCSSTNLLGNLIYVYVGENDRGVVSAPTGKLAWCIERTGAKGGGAKGGDAQLKSDSLQGLAGTPHDGFSRGCRTCKTNLLETRMFSDPRAKVIAAAQGLYYAGGEELLSQFDQLQPAIGRKWPVCH